MLRWKKNILNFPFLKDLVQVFPKKPSGKKVFFLGHLQKQSMFRNPFFAKKNFFVLAINSNKIFSF